MSIVYDETNRVFTLHTAHSTYQLQIAETGHLLHLYYGEWAEERFDYFYQQRDCGFSPNPYALRDCREWSLDTLPQEYSGSNGGDYRLSCVLCGAENGVRGADLRYLRHEIRAGKYTLDRLPAAFAREGEADTLLLWLTDPAAGLTVRLSYGVYEGRDVIARSAYLENSGGGSLRLEKAASLCLDLPFGDWELLHFHGRHCMERQAERTPLPDGILTVGSKRGMSSHQHNPFAVLCAPDATEDRGECYGVMPVYSGSFRTDVERDQMGGVRLVTGIQDEDFCWTLAPGEGFETPEVLLAYTGAGLGELSRIYHRFIRKNLCRSKFSEAPRPVPLNNWEATYFDFDADKLLAIAREAGALGVDLFVLDDGWFGQRSDDHRALGDWFVNEKKLPGGLEPLIQEVNALGLRFGLWLEPEMVSEDSDLYRAHPDWALRVPGRDPAMGRDQLVLDMGRREVVDHLFDALSGLLRRCHTEYIKWDMNRGLSDVYSGVLPPERQGEARHRYVLGFYDLLSRLTAAFPDVLFEGCAGGGGRFDAGVLAYCPQIWCSDNTDALARLKIQRGTSYGYPVSAMGAHVSAVPNHQTGRGVPLGTRAVAAMSGSFGFELDPGALPEAEKAEIRTLLARFREYAPLLHGGDLYRLDDNERFTAWEFAAEDGSAALLNLVLREPEGNPRPIHLRLRGLDPEGVYELARADYYGCALPSDPRRLDGRGETERLYSGAALLRGGWTLPALFGDAPSAQLCFKRRG